MSITARISKQKKGTGKEIPPVSPPEHPVIKPDIHPGKERIEPLRPSPEVLPVPKPEISPEKK